MNESEKVPSDESGPVPRSGIRVPGRGAQSHRHVAVVQAEIRRMRQAAGWRARRTAEGVDERAHA